MQIRALREADDRSRFRSGDPDLDRFLQRFAGQNQFRHYVGVTYVAVEEDGVLGFATVAPGHVEIEGLPAAERNKLPRYPLPVLRLAAKPGAVEFYARYGFAPVEVVLGASAARPQPKPMFLAMRAIKAASDTA